MKLNGRPRLGVREKVRRRIAKGEGISRVAFSLSWADLVELSSELDIKPSHPDEVQSHEDAALHRLGG